MALRQRPKLFAIPPHHVDGHRRRAFARGPCEPLRAQNVGDRTVLHIYGPIGFGGLSAADFSAELNRISGPLTVQITSPGGDCFDGIHIFNSLVAYPDNVRVEVTALAASIASIVCMAGDTLAVAPSAHYMIHSAWSYCQGPARDLRAEASVLESIDSTLVDIYHQRTGLPAKQLESMMIAETWLKGQAILDSKFADELMTPPAKAQAAHFDLSIYEKTPPELKVAASASPRVNVQIESRADLEKQLREKVGLAHGAARKVASAGFAALAGGEHNEIETESFADRIALATNELQMKNKKADENGHFKFS